MNKVQNPDEAYKKRPNRAEENNLELSSFGRYHYPPHCSFFLSFYISFLHHIIMYSIKAIEG